MTSKRHACAALLVFGTLASGFAQTADVDPPEPRPDAQERGELARRFVNEKLDEWRHRLGLEDWRISGVMTRRSELKHGTRGMVRWDKRKRSAVVWVMDAADYRVPVHEMLDDMEFTVVHELLHVALASLPRSEASRRSEEQAVNQIAEALLSLARDGRTSMADASESLAAK
jgi:hypothetical protein